MLPKFLIKFFGFQGYFQANLAERSQRSQHSQKPGIFWCLNNPKAGISRDANSESDDSADFGGP